MKFSCCALVCLSTLLLSSCSTTMTTEKQAIKDDILEKGVYKNHFLDMTIPVPAGWYFESDESQKHFSDIGADMLAGDDQNLKAMLKTSEDQSANLFSFNKYELGAPVAFNPSISAFAEDVSHLPGIKRGGDYHFHTRRLLESSQLDVRVDGALEIIEISGVSFDVMNVAYEFDYATVFQKQYAAKIKNYVFLIVTTYQSETSQLELEAIVKSIQFKANN